MPFKRKSFKIGDTVSVTNTFMKEYEVSEDGKILKSLYEILAIDGERVSLRFKHSKTNSSIVRVNISDLKHEKI